MKRGFKLGVIALFVILSAYLILATVYNQATSTASAGDNIKMLIFNVSSNSTTGNTFTSITVDNIGNASDGNITNITVSNGTWVKSATSFGAITINEVVPNGGNQNYTINFTLSSGATYGTTVQLNVTARTVGANLTVNAAPFNSTATFIAETVAPTATATCSPDTVSSGEDFPCTCSGTDSGDAASGVASASGSSNSPDGTMIPYVKGEFVYTCTVTDNAGNSAGSTAEYIVTGGGGGVAVPTQPKNTHIWTKITPGAATIMQDFDAEIGVKQIEITVNNEAQNVKITVTKYDSKPANVSVAKTGKVYQYLHIDTQNLESSLDNADVQFRVEKTWAASNGVSKEKVAVYKFDESNSKWNELQTTLSSEDSTYYYYDVELASFSYFAISERSLTAGEGTAATGEEVAEEGRSMTWLWVLIALVVVFFVWKNFGKNKKPHSLKQGKKQLPE